MAILRGPYGTTQIKGSIGATTFQAGPYGLTARSRTVPTNPSSTKQNTVRDAWNVASFLWTAAITGNPAFYSAWQNYAQNTSWLNHLGDPVHLSPRSHFMRQVAFQLGGGRAIGDLATDAPALPGLPSPAEIGGTFDTTDGISIDQPLAPMSNDDMQIVQFAGPFNQTKNYFTGPYPYTAYIDATSVTPIELVPPGATAIGQRWFFATRTYRTDLGLSVVTRGFEQIAA